MNERETIAVKRLRTEGWDVLKNGAPDLLVWKTDTNNRTIDHKYIEVKSPTDILTPEQAKHRKVLLARGIKCEIWTVDLNSSEPDITIIDEPPTIQKRSAPTDIPFLLNMFPSLDLTWNNKMQDEWIKGYKIIREAINAYYAEETP